MQEENKMPEEKKIPEGNVHPDKSVLPEDSDFYQPEDTRTTREKLQSMNFKDKVIFIAQYYGLKIAAIVLIAIVVIYFVAHYALAKDTVLNIMAVNAQDIMNSSAAADEQSFYEDFMEANDINLSKSEISIDSSLNVVGDDNTDQSTAMGNMQSVQVQLLAGTDDIMFADEEFFTQVAAMGYLADITQQLPQEVLDQYADDIVYVTLAETQDKVAVGIRLNDNDWINRSGWFANVKGPVIGICAATQNMDLARNFMLYVLDAQQ